MVLLFFIFARMICNSVIYWMEYHRVHRPGKKRKVLLRIETAGNQDITAGLWDFKFKEFVLSNSKVLEGTIQKIQQDYLLEIRSGRAEVWHDYRQAKASKLHAPISHLAKIIVDVMFLRDELVTRVERSVPRTISSISSKNNQFDQFPNHTSHAML